MTFKHLRIDIFKAVFKDGGDCNDSYVNALEVILTTSALSRMSDERLIDLIKMVKAVPRTRLTCIAFPSFHAEDSSCTNWRFWELYFLLVGNIQHGDAHCQCMRIINNETFGFLISARHHSEYFEYSWSPFFGNERIQWYEQYYMRRSETNLYKTDKTHYDALSSILSDMNPTSRYEWFLKLTEQVILEVPYPTYFDKVFTLVLSSWEPTHLGTSYVLHALTYRSELATIFSINSLCTHAQHLLATSSVDAWRLVEEISMRIVIEHNNNSNIIRLLQATVKHLHDCVTELFIHFHPVTVPLLPDPNDVLIEQRLFEQLLNQARDNYKDIENTDEGKRFVAALAIYQVVKNLSRTKLQHISFESELQLLICLLPSFDKLGLFIFIDNMGAIKNILLQLPNE